MAEAWDREVDVLVVGTGAAGLTAAITAAARGRRVLLVESTPKWGGTTAISGGGLWWPTHPLMQGLGLDDSVEKALAYMDAVIGEVGPASSPQRRRAFVETVPEVFAFLAGLGVNWTPSKDYPDYYPERVGGMKGRAVEVTPLDAKRLGSWTTTSRLDEGPPAPIKTDDVWLLARAWSTPDGFLRSAKFVGRTVTSLLRRQRLVGTGGALTTALLSIVLKQGTDVLLSTPLTGLVTDQDSRAVVGATATGADGKELRIRAGDGVILAAGGFARNRDMRQKYHGISGYSSAADGDQGQVITIAEKVGASLALMDDAWWGASVAMPDGRNAFSVWERSMPFSIIVDATGVRYVNESASYIDVGHAMLERDKTVPAVPSWLITEARHRRRYLNTITMAGAKELREAGTLVRADNLPDLATQLGMPPSVLKDTVNRFNSFARTGIDKDFGRGNTTYDNYYGDPRVKPNHNLGPLEKGPFTAIKLVPGDLGTKGGVLTDADARALDLDGNPITGLYAAGNTSASVMGHTYPGPGSTIGPAVVFGYRAARHATSAH